MKSHYKKIGLCLAFIVLAACENASDTVINIPSVRVGCTNTDSNKCDNGTSGQNAVVIMSRSGCSTNTVDFEGIATGSVNLNCDVSGCDGTVSTWTNPDNQESVTEILTGRMDICATIYLNGGVGTPGTGDLVNESSESISSSATISIDSWDVVN